MQVYKLFFKILKKQKNVFIMYIGIYAAILFGILIPQVTREGVNTYMDQNCKYAIMDEDNSILSGKLGECLELMHTKVEIKDFEINTLQDELYARNIRGAVIIKEGFQDAFLKGNANDYLTIYDVPADSASKLFSNDVDEFLRYTESYTKASYSLEEASDRALDVSKKSVDVEIAGAKDVAAESGVTAYMRYLGWIFITMMICGVAPVIVVMDRKELKNRIECSSFEFSKTNLQLILGILTIGAAVCAVFSLAACIYFGERFSGIQAVLHSLNLCALMLVALAIAFLVSKLTTSIMAINMIGNVISLGMGFLSGVFVPGYLLSDTVITIAHFLPTYWYLNAVENIELYTSAKLPSILQTIGIEVLFALVFVVIGLVIANKRRKNS